MQLCMHFYSSYLPTTIMYFHTRCFKAGNLSGRNIQLERKGYKTSGRFEGILQKGPYPPCLRMADRALLAGYPRFMNHGFLYNGVTLKIALTTNTKNYTGACLLTHCHYSTDCNHCMMITIDQRRPLLSVSLSCSTEQILKTKIPHNWPGIPTSQAQLQHSTRFTILWLTVLRLRLHQ